MNNENERIYVTKVIKINGTDYSPLDVVIEEIKKGEIAVIPTETVYGLAGNAVDEKAIRKIFMAKGRQSDNPLIVHISSFDMLKMVSSNEIPKVYEPLFSKFFPGPPYYNP